MKNAGTSGLRWSQVSLLAGCLLVVCLASSAWGQVDYNWNGAAGVQDWGAAANWNPNGVPGDTDNANLVQSDASNRTVSYRNINTPLPPPP